MFAALFNCAIDIATALIEVAKDTVTLGGLANGQDESYTEKRLRKLKEDAENVIDEM